MNTLADDSNYVSLNELNSYFDNNTYSIEEVKKYVFKIQPVQTDSSNSVIYLKTKGDFINGKGPVLYEYNSYLLLQNYLNMPDVKLLNVNGKNVLITESINGIPSDELLKIDSDKFIDCLELFITDLKKMWDKTAVQHNMSSAGINDDCIQRLNKIKQLAASEDFLTKSIYINNREYPSLDALIHKSIYNLSNKNKFSVVLGHGDEHFGNIFYSHTNNEYVIIDPREAKYYPYAKTFERLFARSLAYLVDYQSSSNINEKSIDINYSIHPESNETFRIIKDFLNDLLQYLSDKMEFIREYIFVYLLRSLSDDHEDIIMTSKNKWAHMALAVELLET